MHRVKKTVHNDCGRSGELLKWTKPKWEICMHADSMIHGVIWLLAWWPTLAYISPLPSHCILICIPSHIAPQRYSTLPGRSSSNHSYLHSTFCHFAECQNQFTDVMYSVQSPLCATILQRESCPGESPISVWYIPCRCVGLLCYIITSCALMDINRLCVSTVWWEFWRAEISIWEISKFSEDRARVSIVWEISYFELLNVRHLPTLEKSYQNAKLFNGSKSSS